jgi:hypothetical protein
VSSWLLSDETLKVVHWLGLIVGLIGLALTFREARGAKTAAEAATKAVEQLKGKLNIAHLSYANAQVESVRQLAMQTNYAAALVVLAPTKRTILHANILLSNRGDAKASVETASRNLAIIEAQLSRAEQGAANFKRDVLYRAIQGLTEYLARWEGHLTFDTQENEPHALPK